MKAIYHTFLIGLFFVLIHKITLACESGLLLKNGKCPKIAFFESFSDYIIKSDKWIVITTINPPLNQLKNLLLKLPESWKIIVIGDKKTKNEPWKIFENSNLIKYLSVEDQLKLNYETIKYIPFNSYSRKTIGYLYAIEHGAKEIFEINDNIHLINLKYLNNNVMDETELLTLVNFDKKKMINPYPYFGQHKIWPRGFRLSDIYKNYINNTYNITYSNNIKSKPLISQGILDGDPDVDAIFRLTSRDYNNNNIVKFESFATPLLYLPGNFVPINSQNTKLDYKIFPSIALPTTTSNRVSDIWRGYIIQRFSWLYNGLTLYHGPNFYKDKKEFNYMSDLKNELPLYNDLDKLLNTLNADINKENLRVSEYFIKIIKNLVRNQILKENDLLMYKAYLKDLKLLNYQFDENYTNLTFPNINNLNSLLMGEEKLKKCIIENNNNSKKNKETKNIWININSLCYRKLTQKIRIAFTTFSLSIGGGLERVVSIYVNELAKRDYMEIFLFLNKKGKNTYFISPKVKVFEFCNKRKIKQLLIKNNIQIFVDNTYKINNLRIVKKLGIKIISVMHGNTICPITHQFKNKERYNVADVVLLMIEDNRVLWEMKGIKFPFALPNPNPFNLKKITVSKLNTKNIIMVSRISRCKRIDIGINSMKHVVKKIPEAKLIIVGGYSKGNENYYKNLLKLVGDLNLTKNVEFVGLQKNVGNYLKNASVFILSTTMEGSPMVLPEALSYGLPTILVELPYLFRAKNGGVVNIEKNDDKTIADEIIKILTDKDYRTKLGKAARDNVDFYFTNKEIFDRWTELFYDLLIGVKGLKNYNKKYNIYNRIKAYLNMEKISKKLFNKTLIELGYNYSNIKSN